jgi:excisionase family DNA binding protein
MLVLGYTVAEVAHMLRVDEETVRTMIGRGEIAAERVGKRKFRISPEPLHRKYGPPVLNPEEAA